MKYDNYSFKTNTRDMILYDYAYTPSRLVYFSVMSPLACNRYWNLYSVHII